MVKMRLQGDGGASEQVGRGGGGGGGWSTSEHHKAYEPLRAPAPGLALSQGFLTSKPTLFQ